MNILQIYITCLTVSAYCLLIYGMFQTETISFLMEHNDWFAMTFSCTILGIISANLIYHIHEYVLILNILCLWFWQGVLIYDYSLLEHYIFVFLFLFLVLLFVAVMQYWIWFCINIIPVILWIAFWANKQPVWIPEYVTLGVWVSLWWSHTYFDINAQLEKEPCSFV